MTEIIFYRCISCKQLSVGEPFNARPKKEIKCKYCGCIIRTDLDKVDWMNQQISMSDRFISYVEKVYFWIFDRIARRRKILRKRITADERREQLRKKGFEPKTCWCLDCGRIGLCNSCDGKAMQNPKDPHKTIPPENYIYIEGLKIKEFY